jgi:PAT family beta-lactamase induction signal transducer AmpG
MLICVFTGFSSGLPLYVIYQLIPYWLKAEGVGLKEIGFFALVGIPYTWKFVWSPFMDRYPLPFLGHRRGWMICTQLALLASIVSIGFFIPEQSLWVIAYLATSMAFFSASQDIELDAYRRELLDESELGTGNGIHIQAYRIAGLIPGALGPILSDYLSWHAVFTIVGSFMFVGVMLTLSIEDRAEKAVQDRTLRESVILPFQDFWQRHGGKSALMILSFMFLYKLGDSMATALSYPFFQELGFSGTEIGAIAKGSALIAVFIGGFAAIPLLARYGINKCLWLFGMVQISSILGFAFLAEAGKNHLLLATVMMFEYLGVGLGTAGFTAFIARATSPLFAATQFALLTALTALPRTFANSGAGVIVESIGWTHFFILCTFLALPGMLLLFKVAPWNGK